MEIQAQSDKLLGMEVVLVPDNRLRMKTKPVKKITPALLQTLKRMVDLTKTFNDPEGVGLASTQIGENEQYFVAKLSENGDFKKFINPKILKFSTKTKTYLEGCLSLPSYWGEVERSLSVTISYMDEQGNKREENFRGLVAWIIQHECDHLEGKLFVDRVLEQKGRLFKVIGKDPTGAEKFQEIQL